MIANKEEAALIIKQYIQTVSNIYANKEGYFKSKTVSELKKAFYPLNEIEHEAAYALIKNNYDYKVLVKTYKRFRKKVKDNLKSACKVVSLF